MGEPFLLALLLHTLQIATIIGSGLTAVPLQTPGHTEDRLQDTALEMQDTALKMQDTSLKIQDTALKMQDTALKM